MNLLYFACGSYGYAEINMLKMRLMQAKRFELFLQVPLHAAYLQFLPWPLFSPVHRVEVP